jgi:hypothetical protein
MILFFLTIILSRDLIAVSNLSNPNPETRAAAFKTLEDDYLKKHNLSGCLAVKLGSMSDMPATYATCQSLQEEYITAEHRRLYPPTSSFTPRYFEKLTSPDDSGEDSEEASATDS